MPFTVEDGSGVEGANSYVSVADADAYFALRGAPAAWSAATTAAKEQALFLGTQYIEAHYLWSTGEVGSDDQGLGWPRTNAEDRHGRTIDSDVVPEVVKQATCEAASRAMAGTLLADETQKVVRQKVEGAVEVEYDRNADQGTRYPLIDQLLAGLSGSSEYSSVVVRG